MQAKYSSCVVCGREISYAFGRPKKVCSHECYLIWKRERYYKRLLRERVHRISKADIEFEKFACDCGYGKFAWTMEGVFCLHCGLENPIYSADPWIPAEFAPVPKCRCDACKRTPAYQLWMYA